MMKHVDQITDTLYYRENESKIRNRSRGLSFKMSPKGTQKFFKPNQTRIESATLTLERHFWWEPPNQIRYYGTHLSAPIISCVHFHIASRWAVIISRQFADLHQQSELTVGSERLPPVPCRHAERGIFVVLVEWEGYVWETVSEFYSGSKSKKCKGDNIYEEDDRWTAYVEWQSPK